MTLENKVLVSFSSIIYFHEDDRENGSKICQEIRMKFDFFFSYDRLGVNIVSCRYHFIFLIF